VLFILLPCHPQLPIHCTGLILCKWKFCILPKDVSSAEGRRREKERSQQERIGMVGREREELLLLPIVALPDKILLFRDASVAV
jgi:hypothetical protein